MDHIVVACHAWYGDTKGGSFRLASEFAEHLAAIGFRVSYVCCAASADHQFPRREMIRGVEVYRYRPLTRSVFGLGRFRHHVHQTQHLVEELAAEDPVVAMSGHSPLQTLGAASALRGQQAFVNYTVHSPFDDELLSNVRTTGKYGLGQRFASLAAKWVDRRNAKESDCVQTISNYTLASMIRKHGSVVSSKGVVAPGWVDVERFRPVPDRFALRESLGLEWRESGPLFFTLRRLENRMGLDTLIHACRQVSGEGFRFRMLIGGSGSLSGQLQAMINAANLQDQVRLLGKISEEKLADCYAAADCFVLPTRSLECFGLIVLEAFACDTPVIASSAAAIPELAGRQGNDWMFESGNVTELGSRIKNFIDGNLKPRANLRAIALEFDKEKILPKWASLLGIPANCPESCTTSASIITHDW